jgi:hypothetical protein
LSNLHAGEKEEGVEMVEMEADSVVEVERA